jgi:hypothetical protein
MPRDWAQFIRACGSTKRTIEVTEINIEDFKKFSTLIQGTAAPIVARRKIELEYFMLSKVVWLQERKTNPGT